MEEDIKILESIVEDTKKSIKENIENLSENRIVNRIRAYTALENLIKGYRELEKHIAFYEKHGSYKKRIIELEEENERLKKDYYSLINKIENKIDKFDYGFEKAKRRNDKDRADYYWDLIGNFKKLLEDK